MNGSPRITSPLILSGQHETNYPLKTRIDSATLKQRYFNRKLMNLTNGSVCRKTHQTEY